MCARHRYSKTCRHSQRGIRLLTAGFKRRVLTSAVALLIACTSDPAQAAQVAKFHILEQELADALDRFGEQSGLQIIYDQSMLTGHRVRTVSGDMAPSAALDRLLAGSGLHWSFVNDHTVVVRAAPASTPERAAVESRGAHAVQQGPVTKLSVVQVHADPHRVLPNEASTSAFGFDKKLLDTPRAISFISSEQFDLFGLSAVEDLVRFVPGVFTTTRYGIQGAVDIRNVAGDTYFRGMKRLTLQGHGRSVLAAMDSIEVVRGPPSPIDGMGKVGGFTNVVPKSGRARLGGYLEEPQGFAQGVLGAFDRTEASFGLGGPLRIHDRQGGFYAYGLIEDSDSYTQAVPIDQRVAQAAMTLDDAIGPFRLETGINYQLSGTSGALLNRVTQELIDEGRYIRGDPLAMLDLNGNGKIGYLEYNTASPVRGNLSVSNQPLMQRWAWPVDANGVPLPLADFPRIAGIPESMHRYLSETCNASPAQCADPSGLLRAQGIGGPTPISGYVPAGFMLDPRSVGYDSLDYRRAGAFEREIQAEFVVGFVDLIYDSDPHFTLRNQMFVDRMDQYKVSEQPSGGIQQVIVLADKVTATHRWRGSPSWLELDTLGSLIYRHTRSTGRRYGGDFSSHRTDVMSANGAMTPNTTFAHSYDNPDLHADGTPYVSDYDTRFWEVGAGILFDIDILEHTNILMGGRIDGSNAHNTSRAGRFDPNTGTSENPGAFRMTDDSAEGWDRGASWSVSASHEVLPGVRPYATYARSSLTLDNNNNSLENSVIRTGHVGTARLVEGGIKASLFDDTLFLSSAIYKQWRIDGSASDPSALLSTDISHVTSRGWESEIKWVPAENLFVSLYGLVQKSVYTLDTGANILVDARALGFEDVVDEAGNVVYPAEAFLYGGRAFLVLPTGLSDYEEKQGNPNVQVGLQTTYKFANGFGFTISGNHFSAVHSGRLRLVELPAADILDAGVFWDTGRWRVKFDVNNILDERYFRARTGDVFGDTLVQAMPTRYWQLTARFVF